jgi:hypothetical protein
VNNYSANTDGTAAALAAAHATGVAEGRAEVLAVVRENLNTWSNYPYNRSHKRAVEDVLTAILRACNAATPTGETR